MIVHSRRPADVVDLDDQITALETRSSELDSHQRRLSNRRDLLVQVHNSRKPLGRRAEITARLAQLAEQGPMVPESLAEVLEEQRTNRRTAKVKLTTILSSIELLEAGIEAIEVDLDLLQHRDAIEAIKETLGEDRKNKADLPALKAQADESDRRLNEMRGQLPDPQLLDADGLPRITVDQRARIAQLADRQPELTLAISNARSEKKAADDQLSALRAEVDAMSQPIDVVALVAVVGRIDKQGQLGEELAKRTSEAKKRVGQFETGLAELGLAPVPAADLPLLPVPARETIRKFASDLATGVALVEETTTSINTLETAVSSAERELKDLLASAAPPSYAELTTARSHRDDGWSLIRSIWLDGSDPGSTDAVEWSGGDRVESAYELAVESADEIADRLYSGAEAVARRAALEADIEDGHRRISTLRDKLAELTLDRDRISTEWQELWQPLGITPGSPDEMESWHDNWKERLAMAARIVEDQADIDQRAGAIDQHVDDIVAALAVAGLDAPAGASLAVLLDHAHAIIDTNESLVSKRSSLDERITSAEVNAARRADELKEAEDELVKWRDSWSSALSIISLGSTDTPTTAREVMDHLTEIQNESRALSALTGRIKGINGRIDRFESEVRSVLERLPEHDDLTSDEPAAAVRELAKRLDEALTAVTRRDADTAQLNERRAEAAETRTLESEAERTISELVDEAGLNDEEELSDAIVRSSEHRSLTTELERIESDLRAISAGALPKTVKELETDAREATGIDIPAELTQVDAELEETAIDLTAVNQELGEKRNQRRSIDTTDRAARSAEQAEQALADLGTLIDEYVRVVLARKLIDEQVAAVRDQNQGPLLERAAQLFTRLTIHAYSGLQTDVTDSGEPFLIALTPDGRGRRVEALSTGTRDQLYLALRLAALEQYMERNSPLPLVLDDLFVHFDDDRTTAGLTVLDELAQHTQVLLFTHHRHVAEQAEAAVRTGQLTIHHLVA